MALTDAEVIDAIAEILWPSHDPNREWSSDTATDIAYLVHHARPEHPVAEVEFPDRFVEVIGNLINDGNESLEGTDLTLAEEYDRAISEFLCDYIGYPMQRKAFVLASLRRQYENGVR